MVFEHPSQLSCYWPKCHQGGGDWWTLRSELSMSQCVLSFSCVVWEHVKDSEFVSRGSGRRQWCVPGDTVLSNGANLFLLSSFFSILSVPVCADGLVIPNTGSFCVAEVTRLTCIVCWVQQQRLNRESTQISGIKVRHVCRTERETWGEGRRKARAWEKWHNWCIFIFYIIYYCDGKAQENIALCTTLYNNTRLSSHTWVTQWLLLSLSHTPPQTHRKWSIFIQ